MRKLFYYYKPTLAPLRSVMELSDEKVVDFMRSSLPEDTIFHTNPQRCIRQRRETEEWLYETFRTQGGTPSIRHPVYMTLGPASYIEEMGIYSARLEFPLSSFPKSTVSFTYPDSYVSRLLAKTSDGLFNPKYHGKVFTLSDLDHLLEDGQVHNEAWREKGREKDFFIEAQIWDTTPLKTSARPA